MGACTECRLAKVKCEQSFPCGRCQRLGKNCIPHESRQGQNPSRRKRQRTDPKVPAVPGIVRLEGMLITESRKDHYALKHIVRQWIALSIKRRSFKLWARAGNLAEACGVSMDEILSDKNEEHRSMDFIHRMITSPTEDQLIIGKQPMKPNDVPDILWKAVGMPTDERMEQALNSRWIIVREVIQGTIRFYVSPGFVQTIGVSQSTMEATFRANQMEVSSLFYPQHTKNNQGKDYMAAFVQQLALHSKPGIPPKPSKTPNVKILVGKDKQEKVVDQLLCIYIQHMDISFSLFEFMDPNAQKVTTMNDQQTDLNHLDDFYLDLDSVDGGIDDFKMICDLFKSS
ncbi:expressed unknown protein [Seminavis robusta]|uniref:Zn(2)-C6 fungal-type domain-containing protein n=1 Tax=Seminavis robusta TaxID=568900 RepID=A0A9N8HJ61_9STRA|nr:expressed unknown protein [Seminavis robusta]|eukprot:Sro670_g184740.1 n/a (342) ;mRNA; f:47624-48649